MTLHSLNWTNICFSFIFHRVKFRQISMIPCQVKTSIYMLISKHVSLINKHVMLFKSSF